MMDFMILMGYQAKYNQLMGCSEIIQGDRGTS
jgi:hypothetical protein